MLNNGSQPQLAGVRKGLRPVPHHIGRNRIGRLPGCCHISRPPENLRHRGWILGEENISKGVAGNHETRNERPADQTRLRTRHRDRIGGVAGQSLVRVVIIQCVDRQAAPAFRAPERPACCGSRIECRHAPGGIRAGDGNGVAGHAADISSARAVIRPLFKNRVATGLETAPGQAALSVELPEFRPCAAGSLEGDAGFRGLSGLSPGLQRLGSSGMDDCSGCRIDGQAGGLGATPLLSQAGNTTGVVAKHPGLDRVGSVQREVYRMQQVVLIRHPRTGQIATIRMTGPDLGCSGALAMVLPLAMKLPYPVILPF